MRKRRLGDAMHLMNRFRDGEIPSPLSNADMIAAAIQCVVHAANDETSLELNDWKIRYHAEEKPFLLLCTDASGKKAFYLF